MKDVVINNRKVAVVGCGFVGSATAFCLMQSGLFSEMVLIDADHDKAEGEALDMAHGIPFIGHVDIYAGGYDDIVDAAIVMSRRAQTRNRTRRGLTWCTRMWGFTRALSRRLQTGITREFC